MSPKTLYIGSSLRFYPLVSSRPRYHCYHSRVAINNRAQAQLPSPSARPHEHFIGQRAPNRTAIVYYIDRVLRSRSILPWSQYVYIFLAFQFYKINLVIILNTNTLFARDLFDPRNIELMVLKCMAWIYVEFSFRKRQSMKVFLLVYNNKHKVSTNYLFQELSNEIKFWRYKINKNWKKKQRRFLQSNIYERLFESH